MKPTLFLLLSFYISLTTAQIQIGNDIDGDAMDDELGYSISLSADGTRIAVGARLNDGNGIDAGHVRVYENNAGTWTQVGSDINGEAPNDESGYSVSLSANGRRVAIGAIKNDGSGNNAGHVRIFKENTSGTWRQVGGDIDGEAAGDKSGSSVSLSANGLRVAIGAIENDDNGKNAGQVRIYEQIGTNWTQVGNDIDGEAANDEFGSSVSLSFDGTRIAIGAQKNDGNGNNAGHVRIYEDVAGTWTQVGNDIDGEAMEDESGQSISLSADGTRIAIGARKNSDNGNEAGHVRIYEDSLGNWVQIGNDIDGEATGDQSGFSLSLSSDGTKVVIGARKNSGNGSDAGHVRIYEDVAGTWTQIGNDIDGENSNDRSGRATAISPDGTTLAIGAFRNDGNGNNAGHVRVFDIQSISLSTFPKLEAVQKENSIILQWKVNNERHHNSFEIQKASNTHWKTLDIQRMKKGHYTFSDKNPYIGKNLYRLKIINTSGKIEYSEITTVSFIKNSYSDFQLFPNPTTGVIQLTSNTPTLQLRKITVKDNLGIIVAQYNWPKQTSNYQFNIPSPGIYFITVSLEGNRYYKKIIVNH